MESADKFCLIQAAMNDRLSMRSVLRWLTYESVVNSGQDAGKVGVVFATNAGLDYVTH